MNTLSRTLLALSMLPVLAGCPSKDGGGGDDDTVQVSGVVRNAWGGFVSGAPVWLNGQNATTDSSGAFTFDGVTLPYTLAVLETELDYAFVFVGATRLDPIVLINEATPDSQGDLDVTLSPPGPGTGEVTNIGMKGIYGYGQGGGVDNFTVTANWSGATSVNGTIFASRVVTTNGSFVIDILDTGSEDVAFQENQTTSVTINMSAVTTKTVDITLNPPAGYESGLLGGFLKESSSEAYPMYLGQRPGPAATLTSINSALYETRVQGIAFPTGGSYGDGYGVATDLLASMATAVTLNPPERTLLTAPAALSSVGAGTVVTWTPPAGVTSPGYSVDIGATLPGDTSFHYYIGAGTTFTVPDLSAIGATFSTNEYSLSVGGTQPSLTVDEHLAGTASPVDGLHTLLGTVSEARIVTGAP